MEKPKVYVRLSTSDIVIPKEDANNINSYLTVKTKDGQILTDVEVYSIGYELEDGTECNEDGTEL